MPRGKPIDVHHVPGSSEPTKNPALIRKVGTLPIKKLKEMLVAKGYNDEKKTPPPELIHIVLSSFSEQELMDYFEHRHGGTRRRHGRRHRRGRSRGRTSRA
jgi:hypothetical protein